MMQEKYKALMLEQALSDEAKERFYNRLETPRRKNILLKMVVIAACICMMVSVTVFAADRIFGVGIVEIIAGRMEGYRIGCNDIRSRPIGDFSEDIRHIEDISYQAFDSWEEAEEAIGFDLMDNAFFAEDGTYPERMLTIPGTDAGKGKRLHCYADYYGTDGQLYRAAVTASYVREMTHITVTAAVTAEHPAIPSEDEELFHSAGKLYESRYIKEITEETYTAQSGLIASVVQTEWNTLRAPDYEAVFVVNGISYWVSVSKYPLNREEEAKSILFEIVEGF